MMRVPADTLPVYKEWRRKDDEGTDRHTACVQGMEEQR